MERINLTGVVGVRIINVKPLDQCLIVCRWWLWVLIVLVLLFA